jgi:hypothetical protein
MTLDCYWVTFQHGVTAIISNFHGYFFMAFGAIGGCMFQFSHAYYHWFFNFVAILLFYVIHFDFCLVFLLHTLHIYSWSWWGSAYFVCVLLELNFVCGDFCRNIWPFCLGYFVLITIIEVKMTPCLNYVSNS